MPAEQDQPPIERRVSALSDGLQRRVDLIATMMRPDNRPVFHQRLSQQDALVFWRKHRFDDLGQSVLSTWRPDQVLDLDQRLAQANADEGMGVQVNGSAPLG